MLTIAGTAASDRARISAGGVTVVCPLTVGGSFEAKTKAISGEVASQRETGGALRDRHMRDNYLQVGKGAGYDVAVLDGIQVDASDGKGAFRGVLTLHGQKRNVAGTAIIRRRGDGSAHVDAEFPLKVSEFQIPKPTYLGVGVKDEIQVKVAFTVEPMATGITH